VNAWDCLRASRAGQTGRSAPEPRPNSIQFFHPRPDCADQPAGAAAETGGVSASQVAPGAPTNLTFLILGTTVALSWTAPSTGDPTTTYVIEVGSTAGALDIAYFSTGNPNTSLTATNVPNGTYYVRVRGSNFSGIGPASNEIVVVVGGTGSCTAAPPPPTGLSVSLSGFSVTLTWTAPAGGNAATSYVIEAGTSAGSTNLVVFDTGSSATTLSAIAGPGVYFARARSKNQCGTSAPSNEIVITIGSISCGYRMDTAATQTFGAQGGSGNITLTASSGCQWYVDESANSEDFVEVSASTITGSGTRSFTVHSNTTAPQPPLPRSGPVYVFEAGSNLRLFTVTVTQDLTPGPPTHPALRPSRTS
jgi:hypothetical protein